MEVLGMNEKLIELYNQIRKDNPEMSLDEVLIETYNQIKTYDVIKKYILEANNIDEMTYYTKDVNPELKEFIRKKIFPIYKFNDLGHNLTHIIEVIRRSFALNETFKLNLDHNMMYTIAACHDWGKCENSDLHHEIAAAHFYETKEFKKYFNEEQRIIIKEAIEDHRSSKKEEPRSVYGKLISSADRNTSIEIVFIRSFFVAHERTPEMQIDEYLDFTVNRLAKRYSLENPENMHFEDRIYKNFLADMRDLLSRPDDFKNLYCEINGITSRNKKVEDFKGVTSYALKYTSIK